MSAGDETVAEHYLAALRSRGIERLFFNAGTDFAPLVEAYARGAESNAPPFPEPILATHENLAIGMAHGAHLVTGRAAGGDGARQRRHGQRDLRSAERRARPHPDSADGRPLADPRSGCSGRARSAHPLGPGDVRSGRHGARTREVGLRTARCAAGRRRGRSRRRNRNSRTEGTDLSDVAARVARLCRRRRPRRGRCRFRRHRRPDRGRDRTRSPIDSPRRSCR